VSPVPAAKGTKAVAPAAPPVAWITPPPIEREDVTDRELEQLALNRHFATMGFDYLSFLGLATDEEWSAMTPAERQAGRVAELTEARMKDLLKNSATPFASPRITGRFLLNGMHPTRAFTTLVPKILTKKWADKRRERLALEMWTLNTYESHRAQGMTGKKAEAEIERTWKSIYTSPSTPAEEVMRDALLAKTGWPDVGRVLTAARRLFYGRNGDPSRARRKGAARKKAEPRKTAHEVVNGKAHRFR
jgi:hypothetical protein